MKTIISLFCLVFSVVQLLHSQCSTCVPVFSSCPANGGLCTQLDTAHLYEPYDQVVNFYFPHIITDPNVLAQCQCNYVEVLTARVMGVNNLPAGMSYTASQGGNYDVQNGDTLSCIRFCGTPVTTGDYNITYNIQMDVIARGTPGGDLTQDSVPNLLNDTLTVMAAGDTTVCISAITGTDGNGWGYADYVIPAGYKIDSVFGDFTRVGYPANDHDFVFEYCPGTVSYILGGSVSPWNYLSVNTSLYQTWIDLTSYNYSDVGMIRVSLPTVAGAAWSNVCIAMSPVCAMDVNIAPANLLNCLVTSVVLNASSATPGATFDWGGGVTTSFLSVTTPGSYSVTATDPANGCSAIDSVEVVQNLNVPNVSIAPPANLTCTVVSVTLTASSTTFGATYKWGPPPPLTTPTRTVTSPGTYTVTVTDPVSKCTASASVTVSQVLALPNVTIPAPADLNCMITSVNIVASSTTPGITYSWNGGSTTSSISTAFPGTYSVTVTDPANGCTASASTIVFQNISVPNVSIAPPATINCAAASVILYASSSTPGAAYNWGGGNTISTNTVSSPGTYSVTVIDPANSCTASLTVSVSQNTVSPNVSIAPPASLGCGITSVTLSASSTTPGVTYDWAGGNISTTKTVTAPGNYAVTVTDPTNGCSASATVTVIQSQVIADPIVGSNSPVNTGSSINLTASTIANATYLWTGPNGFTSTQQNPVITNATAANAGAYTVVATAGSCSSNPVGTVVVVNNANSFTLYMDSVIGYAGQQAVVSIRVKNFNQILSTQGTIQFDPAVLGFAQAEQFGIGSLGSGSFGTTQAANGLITFAWSDPTLTGVTLADGSKLFALRFNVIGTGGQFSAVTLVNSPTLLEFVDVAFNVITNYSLLPGRVDIPLSSILSGRLRTETGVGIRSATVAAAGNINFTQVTDLSGNYSFTLPQNTAYTLTPSKVNDTIRTNGITTLDVLLIQRHVLGTQLLTSAYKIIAADVNGSNTVTTLDINLINAMILGNISIYPNNKLWAFVPSDYVFANPQNPFPYPVSRVYASVSSLTGQDFIGMKQGDVNNTYNPAVAKTGATDTVQLYTEDKVVAANSVITLPVKVRRFINISGFQLTLQWDTTVLRYKEVDTTMGALRVNYGANMAGEGELRVNWTDPGALSTSLVDDTAIFYVKYEVVGSSGDSTNLSVVSTATTPLEVYDGNLNIADVHLSNGVVSVVAPNNVAVEMGEEPDIMVYPNPATDLLFVEAGSVGRKQIIEQIDVYNMVGTLLSQTRQPVNSRIDISQLAAGVYIAEIRVKGATVKKRWVKM